MEDRYKVVSDMLITLTELKEKTRIIESTNNQLKNIVDRDHKTLEQLSVMIHNNNVLLRNLTTYFERYKNVYKLPLKEKIKILFSKKI